MIQRILIFGNSGSGKSTLARSLSKRDRARHLDLDTVAWRTEAPTTRAPFQDSANALRSFTEASASWIIEGCYSDLLGVVAGQCTLMIFLNPGVNACVANCLARPWEPHKYPTREAQDANLRMLVGWVRDYDKRNDEFSLAAHRRLFDEHRGKKIEITSQLASTPLDRDLLYATLEDSTSSGDRPR